MHTLCMPLAVLQVLLGRVGVFLASLLERRRAAADRASLAGKKFGFRVTSSEVAQAYHLLHQLSMTGEPVLYPVRLEVHSLLHCPLLAQLQVWVII